MSSGAGGREGGSKGNGQWGKFTENKHGEQAGGNGKPCRIVQASSPTRQVNHVAMDNEPSVSWPMCVYGMAESMGSNWHLPTAKAHTVVAEKELKW